MVEVSRLVSRFILVQLGCVAWLTWASPAPATTLLRKGLEQLTVENETVLQGRVVGIHSYWNADHSFILTDVRVHPTRTLKGAAGPAQDHAGDVDITVIGGSVGEVTVLLLGGADLVPGSEYVLFLGHSDLPGAAARLTIPDHAQGVFRVERDRAVSQAVGDPLLPDGTGSDEAAGGAGGLALDDLVREIRAHADGQAR